MREINPKINNKQIIIHIFLRLVMKKILLLSISLIIFSSVNLFSQAKLEVIGGDTYNWGEVSPKQSPLKAEIILKNVGQDTVQIKDLKAGCGCATPMLTKRSILPNDTAKLIVSLNIQGNSGMVNKSVTLSTNESNASRYIFLKCNVIVPLEVLPQKWFTFTKVQVGQETKSSLRLKNNTSNDLVIKEVKSSQKTMSLDLKAGLSLKPKEEINITATVIPDKPGQLNGVFEIITDNIECNQNISVYGLIEESAFLIEPAK